MKRIWLAIISVFATSTDVYAELDAYAEVDHSSIRVDAEILRHRGYSEPEIEEVEHTTFLIRNSDSAEYTQEMLDMMVENTDVLEALIYDSPDPTFESIR